MVLKAMTSSTLLPAFQTRVLEALKAEGLVQMSAGTTRPVRVAENFSDLSSLLMGEADDTKLRYGGRTSDRYSGTADSYSSRRFAMLASLEGVSLMSYPDNGNRSVAIGFNMDKENARSVWADAFGDTVSFDDVYAGTASITTAQAKQLFDHDILYYERVVDTATAGKPLSENERLGLVSIAVNAPKRLSDLKPVLTTGTPEQITAALLTQTYNPNNPYAEALKQRRYVETSIFNSSAEAQSLMPQFEEYRTAVDVSGPKTLVNGREVTDMNTQMALMPTASGDIRVTPMTDNLAAFSYVNQGAKRNLPVTGDLETNIRQAVTSVYGADHRVEIISGGQQKGVSNGVTGSRRHNTMVAADVYVYDAAGKRLTAEQMKPLAQDWIARDIGSVGLPTNGSTQSMHLDLVGGSGPGATPLKGKETRFWFYGGEDAAMRTTLNSKTAPNYMLSPLAVAQGLVPPGSLPDVGSELSTGRNSAPPTPANKSDTVRAKQVAAMVQRDVIGQNVPLPRERRGYAPSVMDLEAIAAKEAREAAAGSVKPVKAPVQGLRLPTVPGASDGKVRTAFDAINEEFAKIANVISNPFGNNDVKPAPAVPAAVRQAAVPGKSPLADGATATPSGGTGTMTSTVKPVAAAPVVRPATTVSSNYVTQRTQPVFGVSATGARTDYGASPGQSTAGLKPGDRVYNADTNSWELK